LGGKAASAKGGIASSMGCPEIRKYFIEIKKCENP